VTFGDVVVTVGDGLVPVGAVLVTVVELLVPVGAVLGAIVVVVGLAAAGVVVAAVVGPVL
jgi:hypothetical protein